MKRFEGCFPGSALPGFYSSGYPPTPPKVVSRSLRIQPSSPSQTQSLSSFVHHQNCHPHNKTPGHNTRGPEQGRRFLPPACQSTIQPPCKHYFADNHHYFADDDHYFTDNHHYFAGDDHYFADDGHYFY